MAVPQAGPATPGAGPDGTGPDGAGLDSAGQPRRVEQEFPRPDARPDHRAAGVQAMVERQIRQAQERGLFDNLPGAGRPLRHLGAPHDENWWLRQYLLREGVSGAAFLPPALTLRREAEDLPGRVRAMFTEAQVRAAVGHLNERILDALRMPAEGPPMTLMQVDVEAIVFGWRISRISPVSHGSNGAGSAAVPTAPTADLAAESRPGPVPRRGR